MKIKKTVKWIFTTIQMALFAFAVGIYYLSYEKMGVMRSLTYRNEVYVKFALKNKIFYGLIVMLFLFSSIAIKKYKKLEKCKKDILFIVLNLLTILFAVYSNGALVLSYYVLLISFFLFLAIQLIKFKYL